MKTGELTKEEWRALAEVGKMLSRVIPDDIRADLIQRGYIEQKLGGLVGTSKGNQYMLKHGRPPIF